MEIAELGWGGAAFVLRCIWLICPVLFARSRWRISAHHLPSDRHWTQAAIQRSNTSRPRGSCSSLSVIGAFDRGQVPLQQPRVPSNTSRPQGGEEENPFLHRCSDQSEKGAVPPPCFGDCRVSVSLSNGGREEIERRWCQKGFDAFELRASNRPRHTAKIWTGSNCEGTLRNMLGGGWGQEVEGVSCVSNAQAYGSP